MLLLNQIIFSSKCLIKLTPEGLKADYKINKKYYMIATSPLVSILILSNILMKKLFGLATT